MRPLSAITALVMLSHASVAIADSASARAEALFKDAQALKAAGKIGEACTALDAIQSIDPNLGTLMYLADCRESNGQLATAWGLFIQAEQQTRAAADDEGKQIRIGAANRAAALEPRLSRLTIIVPPDHRMDGLEVRRGATPVLMGEWGRGVPLDGGRYTIEARANGMSPWSTTVELATEADSKSVEVPKLAAAADAPLPPASSTSPQPLDVDARTEPRGNRLTLLYVGLGVTGVGVVAGVVFGGLALSSWKKARTGCTEQAGMYVGCPPGADDLRKDAETRATISTVGFVVAGAGVVLTAVAYLSSRGKDRPSPSRTVHVVPAAGSGLVGLSAVGHF